MDRRNIRWIRQRGCDLYGANVRSVKKAWRSIGGSFEPVAKTGETVFRHPALERPIIVGRNKNASRILVRSFLRLAEATTAVNKERKKSD
ncbi:MAG: hypothetical protein H0T51_07600 [Pirellulales bacterium]|nr:hypothetical protein [Pirellulales bacterium]